MTINTRNKMYETNSKIKKYLVDKNVSRLYLFPHSRFYKDYILFELGFDAMGFIKVNNVFKLILFQFKTNETCPRSVLCKYDELMKEYDCIPCWVTRFDKKHLTKKHPNEIEVFCPINIL